MPSNSPGVMVTTRVSIRGSICAHFADATHAGQERKQTLLPERAEKSPVLELAPYGIWTCGVTTADGKSAIIVTWVTQISFTPPVIGVALENDRWFLDQLLKAERFTLCALPRDGGKKIAQRILKEGMDIRQQGNAGLFRTDAAWGEAVKGALAALDCRIVSQHAHGDHTLVVAAVVGEKRWTAGAPLRLSDTGWKYRRPVPGRGTTKTN